MLVILSLLKKVLNVFRETDVLPDPLSTLLLCLASWRADLYRLHQPDLLALLHPFGFSQWEAPERKQRMGKERSQNIHSFGAVKRT